MKSHLIVFALVIGLTLYATFFVWNIVQRSYLPAAVQAAAERGERLPAYQTLGVDLADSRTGWSFWGVAAIGAYWWLTKKERKQPVGVLVYFGFAAPLIATSALLIVPLAV